MTSLVLPFVLRGLPGTVRVDIEPNASPINWGDVDPWDSAWAGLFPTCTAVIEHPADGYPAMCGWVQFVQSTDADDPTMFEMDPTPVTAGLDLPYCWYGIRPNLFDGPSRTSRQDLTWRARSFLCASPDGFMTRTVQPIAGFSWGFDVKDGVIAHVAPEPLELSSWREHLGLLRSTYPSWIFSEVSS
jgi:hypothetical protein